MLPSIFDRGELLPAAPTADDIERLAQYMLMLEPEHGVMDLQTVNHLSGKVYGRSVVIPAGTVLVGLPHKVAGLAVCVGDITVWTEGHSERLTGAHILTTQPGGYRVGLAHADTTWLTVHDNPSGTTDIEAIEAAIVEGPERLLTRRAAQGVLQ